MAKVYLVGAGPGSADLLTLRARRLLEQANVVIYDRLVGREVLALVNPFATSIYAGKTKGQQEEVQAEIFAHFLRLRDEPVTVVRLKSGDPTVFGRAGEELAFLAEHGIEAEVVPGISSALAAPALAGIPLTLRHVASSFTVIAGHRESVESIDWSAYARIDTLIVLMGVENRALIAQSLIAQGRSPLESVAFIENASTPRERVIESTLAEVRNERVDVRSPAIFVIGNVVRHRALCARAALEALAC